MQPPRPAKEERRRERAREEKEKEKDSKRGGTEKTGGRM